MSGVLLSHIFESAQNRLGFKWAVECVNRRLNRITKEAFNRVYETALLYDISLRIAAYIVVIDKVAKTYIFRGGF